MGELLKALLIALSLPALTQLFLALAGFLQLGTWSASWVEAAIAGHDVPLNLGLAQAAAAGILFAIAFPHRQRTIDFLEAVHVRPLVGSVVGLCFVAGAALQFDLAEIGNLTQRIWPLSFEELARIHRLLTPTTWWRGVTASFAFVIVAPISEEFVFRGWLLPSLRQRYGTTVALVWSSVLFGLAHYHWPGAVVYATLAGLVLGAVALWTKSILSSIAMHAGINAVPLLVPASLVQIEGFNTLSHRIEDIRPAILLASTAVAAGALWLVWKATREPR